MSEWEPIESAPKDGTFILMYKSVGTHYLDNEYTPFYVCQWLENGTYGGPGWFYGEGEFFLRNPTHWMPLPAPPRKKHYCENPYMRCYTFLPKDDVLVLQIGKEIKEHVVKFCPLCGENADG